MDEDVEMIISIIVWILFTVVMALVAVLETAVWIVVILAAALALVIIIIIAIATLILIAGIHDIICWPVRKAIKMKKKRGAHKEKLFKPLKDSKKESGSDDG